MNLRTDLTKDERALALKVCGEILESFKHYNDSSSTKKGGIFQNLEIAQTSGTQENQEVARMEDEEDEDNGGDLGNIDDFLKQGGLEFDPGQEDGK